MNSRVYSVRKSCEVPLCGNTAKKHPDKLFIYVPHDKTVRNKWFNLARGDPTVYSVNTTIYFCEDHFDSKDITSPATSSTRILSMGTHLQNGSNIKQRKLQVTEQDAQPGPSQILETRTPIDSGGRPQDPVTQVVQQCRFCGEYSKGCVAVSSDMAYLASNKTTLALNDTSVQLDFNDRSLPKTVCRDCDAKLQEFCDFVNVVKAAQGTLINVAQEKAEFEETTADFEESTAEYEEIEILVVKTENSDDDEEGIVDPLAVGETIFNKTYKRKSDKDTATPKKLKAKEKCDDDLVNSIKEEVVEKDTNEQFEVSVTGTDVKPSKLELETSALVFKMAGDGTCEYQGY